MKRFLKTLTFLSVGLFLLVSSVDTTLDHMSRSASQSTYTWYDAKGNVVFAYNGDIVTKPYPKRVPFLIHRTSLSESGLPSAQPATRWY